MSTLQNSSYSLKKTKLLRLVIVLSLVYAVGLAVLDILGISNKIEYRAPLMISFAISNAMLYYWINKSKEYNKNILYTMLFTALIVFTISMIIYPKSEIRVMWYFFTIMIAYFVGGTKVGNVVALVSAVILVYISLNIIDFSHAVIAYFVMGILFMSQISNYFVKILDDNEADLQQYQHHLEDMIENGLKEIAGLNKEITDTQKEVVFTMGAIGESRSKETGNHVKRVSEYSKILARKYGMSEDDVELLHLSSPMHDIGKVGIPDDILKKPGKLTDEEFDVMKTHAILGYDMLKYSTRPILKAAATVAYEHHERWDGKGYPQGLKGEEIHIYGRITAIADIFDALGSDRCYKKAWDDEKIFNLYREERGKIFDPKLVDIFFESIDEILAIREKFKDN